MENKTILIDKPAGISSFGVVAKVRSKLKAEFGHKVKVGHTGTLDPFATGLLILLSGKMTKKSNEFLKQDKEYIATLKLGYTSTTGDPEGEITEYQPNEAFDESFSEPPSLAPVVTGLAQSMLLVSRKRSSKNSSRASSDGMDKPCQCLSEEISEPGKARISAGHPWRRADRTRLELNIDKVLRSFLGEITQTPPRFSAIKINGQRAYKLARKNQDFEIPSRKVTIYSIDILEYNYPYLKIKTKVSSGTYIRTLAEDIGKKLGTGAYLTELRRTKIGNYSVEDAEKLVL